MKLVVLIGIVVLLLAYTAYGLELIFQDLSQLLPEDFYSLIDPQTGIPHPPGPSSPPNNPQFGEIWIGPSGQQYQFEYNPELSKKLGVPVGSWVPIRSDFV